MTLEAVEHRPDSRITLMMRHTWLVVIGGCLACLLDRHRLHGGAVGVVVVVGKAVDDHPGDRLRDGFRRLEGQREDADEVVLGEGKLLGRHPLGVEAADLRQDVVDGLDGDAGGHGRPRSERPGLAAEVEVGPSTVGVALLLPELQVEAGGEQPTEDRDHERDREEVRGEAGDADVADGDRRLDSARAADEGHRGRFQGLRHRQDFRGGLTALPGTEESLGDRGDVDPVQVAGHDERGVLGAGVAPEVGLDGIAV